MGWWGYRFYDPGTGRWCSRDPIGEHNQVLYPFLRNRLIDAVDAHGLFECQVVQNSFSNPEDAEGAYREGKLPYLMRNPGGTTYLQDSLLTDWRSTGCPNGGQYYTFVLSCVIYETFMGSRNGDGFNPDVSMPSGRATYRQHEDAHVAQYQRQMAQTESKYSEWQGKCICPECREAVQDYLSRYYDYYGWVATLEGAQLDVDHYADLSSTDPNESYGGMSLISIENVLTVWESVYIPQVIEKVNSACQ